MPRCPGLLNGVCPGHLVQRNDSDSSNDDMPDTHYMSEISLREDKTTQKMPRCPGLLQGVCPGHIVQRNNSDSSIADMPDMHYMSEISLREDKTTQKMPRCPGLLQGVCPGHLVQRSDSDSSIADMPDMHYMSAISSREDKKPTPWVNPCLKDNYTFEAKDLEGAPPQHDKNHLYALTGRVWLAKTCGEKILEEMFTDKYFKGMKLYDFDNDTKFYSLQYLPPLSTFSEPRKFLSTALTDAYGILRYFTVAFEEILCDLILFDQDYAKRGRELLMHHEKVMCEMAMCHQSLMHKAIPDEQKAKAAKYKMQLCTSVVWRNMRQYLTLWHYSTFLQYVSDMYMYYHDRFDEKK